MARRLGKVKTMLMVLQVLGRLTIFRVALVEREMGKIHEVRWSKGGNRMA